ncbi:MAG: trigger factor [Candidatus Binataceae bacterium]|nr:trigger factor [Candidatus Binataceae bacterium]
MNINLENTSALRRKLTVELEPVEIKRELDRAYGELRRGVQMKGFRPGRAPRWLLERFFGDQVRSDVIQRLVKEYTDKALEEQNLKPMVSPEIITEETDLTKAIRFSAVFDVRPDLVVRDYEGLKVPRGKVEVADEELEKTLERMRERFGTLKKVEDRKLVESGDFVLTELDGRVEGKSLPGLKTEDRLLQVTPGALAHGLDEVLTGAETGTQVVRTRSYPEDYAEKEIAGKSVEWRVTPKEIFRRELPTIDDEFAKDQGYESLEDLRGKIRDQMLEQARREADNRVRNGLLDLIIERNPFELPESLIDREQRALESELAATLEASGMAHEEAHARAHENAGELRNRAEKRARTALLVDAIGNQENVEVTDEEVAERIARAVRESGRDRDRVAQFYGDENNRVMLRDSLRREKTIDLAMTRAQIEEQEEQVDSAPAGAGE